MAFDPRSLGVATAGFAAFVNLYSPQALLPELAREFHVGPGEISALMTAGTAAIALSAPFTGALASYLHAGLATPQKDDVVADPEERAQDALSHALSVAE